MARRLALLASAALLLPLTPSQPAHANPATFVFQGTAWENCFGCGVTNGGFTGTLTGVVNGHTYTNARLTMTYSANNAVGTACVITASANGTMEVADHQQRDVIGFNWTRTYYKLVVMSLHGAVGGAAVATYVVTSPVGLPCGHPITIDMRGTGFGT